MKYHNIFYSQSNLYMVQVRFLYFLWGWEGGISQNMTIDDKGWRGGVHRKMTDDGDGMEKELKDKKNH